MGRPRGPGGRPLPPATAWHRTARPSAPRLRGPRRTSVTGESRSGSVKQAQRAGPGASGRGQDGAGARVDGGALRYDSRREGRATRYRCLIVDHDDTAVDGTRRVHYPAHLRAMQVLRPDLVPVDIDTWFLKNFDPGIMAFLVDE